jgi:hypothetical protein
VFIRDMLLHRSKCEPGSSAHAHDAPGAPAAGANEPEQAWPFSTVAAAPNRAQAEEMRRRTFLPYRQGLLGCLSFGSHSHGSQRLRRWYPGSGAASSAASAARRSRGSGWCAGSYGRAWPFGLACRPPLRSSS